METAVAELATDSDELEEEADWENKPLRWRFTFPCLATFRDEGVSASVSGSTTRGVVPNRAPSLRDERRRRERCSLSRVFFVGGGAAGYNMVAVIDMGRVVTVAKRFKQ